MAPEAPQPQGEAVNASEVAARLRVARVEQEADEALARAAAAEAAAASARAREARSKAAAAEAEQAAAAAEQAEAVARRQQAEAEDRARAAGHRAQLLTTKAAAAEAEVERSAANSESLARAAEERTARLQAALEEARSSADRAEEARRREAAREAEAEAATSESRLRLAALQAELKEAAAAAEAAEAATKQARERAAHATAATRTAEAEEAAAAARQRELAGLIDAAKAELGPLQAELESLHSTLADMASRQAGAEREAEEARAAAAARSAAAAQAAAEADADAAAAEASAELALRRKRRARAIATAAGASGAGPRAKAGSADSDTDAEGEAAAAGRGPTSMAVEAAAAALAGPVEGALLQRTKAAAPQRGSGEAGGAATGPAGAGSAGGVAWVPRWVRLCRAGDGWELQVWRAAAAAPVAVAGARGGGQAEAAGKDSGKDSGAREGTPVTHGPSGRKARSVWSLEAVSAVGIRAATGPGSDGAFELVVTVEMPVAAPRSGGRGGSLSDRVDVVIGERREGAVAAGAAGGAGEAPETAIARRSLVFRAPGSRGAPDVASGRHGGGREGSDVVAHDDVAGRPVLAAWAAALSARAPARSVGTVGGADAGAEDVVSSAARAAAAALAEAKAQLDRERQRALAAEDAGREAARQSATLQASARASDAALSEARAELKRLRAAAAAAASAAAASRGAVSPGTPRPRANFAFPPEEQAAAPAQGASRPSAGHEAEGSEAGTSQVARRPTLPRASARGSDPFEVARPGVVRVPSMAALRRGAAGGRSSAGRDGRPRTAARTDAPEQELEEALEEQDEEEGEEPRRRQLPRPSTGRAAAQGEARDTAAEAEGRAVEHGSAAARGACSDDEAGGWGPGRRPAGREQPRRRRGGSLRGRGGARSAREAAAAATERAINAVAARTEARRKLEEARKQTSAAQEEAAAARRQASRFADLLRKERERSALAERKWRAAVRAAADGASLAPFGVDHPDWPSQRRAEPALPSSGRGLGTDAEQAEAAAAAGAGGAAEPTNAPEADAASREPASQQDGSDGAGLGSPAADPVGASLSAADLRGAVTAAASGNAGAPRRGRAADTGTGNPDIGEAHDGYAAREDASSPPASSCSSPSSSAAPPLPGATGAASDPLAGHSSGAATPACVSGVSSVAEHPPSPSDRPSGPGTVGSPSPRSRVWRGRRRSVTPDGARQDSASPSPSPERYRLPLPSSPPRASASADCSGAGSSSFCAGQAHHAVVQPAEAAVAVGPQLAGARARTRGRSLTERDGGDMDGTARMEARLAELESELRSTKGDLQQARAAAEVDADSARAAHAALAGVAADVARWGRAAAAAGREGSAGTLVLLEAVQSLAARLSSARREARLANEAAAACGEVARAAVAAADAATDAAGSTSLPPALAEELAGAVAAAEARLGEVAELQAASRSADAERRRSRRQPRQQSGRRGTSREARPAGEGEAAGGDALGGDVDPEAAPSARLSGSEEGEEDALHGDEAVVQAGLAALEALSGAVARVEAAAEATASTAAVAEGFAASLPSLSRSPSRTRGARPRLGRGEAASGSSARRGDETALAASSVSGWGGQRGVRTAPGGAPRAAVAAAAAAASQAPDDARHRLAGRFAVHDSDAEPRWRVNATTVTPHTAVDRLANGTASDAAAARGHGAAPATPLLHSAQLATEAEEAEPRKADPDGALPPSGPAAAADLASGSAVFPRRLYESADGECALPAAGSGPRGATRLPRPELAVPEAGPATGPASEVASDATPATASVLAAAAADEAPPTQARPRATAARRNAAEPPDAEHATAPVAALLPRAAMLLDSGAGSLRAMAHAALRAVCKRLFQSLTSPRQRRADGTALRLGGPDSAPAPRPARAVSMTRARSLLLACGLLDATTSSGPGRQAAGRLPLSGLPEPPGATPVPVHLWDAEARALVARGGGSGSRLRDDELAAVILLAATRRYAAAADAATQRARVHVESAAASGASLADAIAPDSTLADAVLACGGPAWAGAALHAWPLLLAALDPLEAAQFVREGVERSPSILAMLDTASLLGAQPANLPSSLRPESAELRA